jgi:hypothetical protein
MNGTDTQRLARNIHSANFYNFMAFGDMDHDADDDGGCNNDSATQVVCGIPNPNPLPHVTDGPCCKPEGHGGHHEWVPKGVGE